MFSRIWCVLLCSLVACSAHAGVVSSLPSFSKTDRVLVLAPHPDDEAIGTGGVIQEALKAGARVKVVLMTNGENNELSFIVYKKRPILTPAGILKMGEVRYRESVAAMASLGLDQRDIVALGYPDFGTMEIMTRCWGAVGKKPFRAMLSRQRQVPYKEARSFGSPYVGESILKDVKDVLVDFKPNKIFVSHPVDVNRDHRATYLFLKVALWDLAGELPQPEVFPYLIHMVGWPTPRGYFPDKVQFVPPELVKGDISWETIALDRAVIQKKQEAIKFYVSQNKAAPKYLVTFARRNEIFGDYPPVPIVKQMSSQVTWQQVGAEEGRAPSIKARASEQISRLSYARQGNNLLIRIQLKNIVNEGMGVTVYLMGYRRDVAFGEMPKIKMTFSGRDGLHIKDQTRKLSSREILFSVGDKEMTFTVPLSFLGSPERILSSAKTALYDLPFDETGWRELVIK